MVKLDPSVPVHYSNTPSLHHSNTPLPRSIPAREQVLIASRVAPGHRAFRIMGAKFWNRLAHECDLWQRGPTLVAGVDEAGCGPLAGPVVAAAVVFPNAWLTTGLYSKLRGLNDSKPLDRSEESRVGKECRS